MSDDFAAELAALGGPLLEVMVSMEQTARWLDPPRVPHLRELLAPRGEKLREAIAAFRAVEATSGLERLKAQLLEAADHAEQSIALFVDPGPAEQTLARVLESMRQSSLAQEALYPLHTALPPVARFFTEAPLHGRLAGLDPDPPSEQRTGIQRAVGPDGPDGRGGFFLYVPESCDGSEALPLIVALHGGHGHGRSFLWTWLREARSRRCLLLAPTSLGPTWSFQGPDLDAPIVHAIVAHVLEGWSVDPGRILLTGLSDGATYTLFLGLREESPFSALAPLSGVLHPSLLRAGGLDRARGRRIYLVHGARDWMFPVGIARLARDTFQDAGADLVYREIEDLSHAYAREENARILAWLDPALALALD